MFRNGVDGLRPKPYICFNEAKNEGTSEMFTLHKDAKFQGYDAEGLAIYAKTKIEVVKKSCLTLDPLKLAKVRADREAINAMFGN